MNDGFDFPRLRLSRQQIRLIKLQYEPRLASCICCNMTVHDLKPDLKYTALSYMWGEESCNKISINGDDFYIYDNLFDFLTLRSTNAEICRNTYLWVDQICIDQSNIDESNHQVNLMSKIYQVATSTIVWLGLPGKGNAMGGNVASKVTSAIRELVCTSQSLTRIAIPVEDFIAPAELNSAADVLCRHPLGIIRLLESAEFWKRLWIIQEILLSKHVVLQCGPHTIEWAHLERCFELWVPLDQKLTTASFAYSALQGSDSKDLVDNPQDATSGSNPKRVSIQDDGLEQLGYLVQRKKRFLSGDSIGLTWKEALQLSRESMCSRIHDKVFGLLGIVRVPLRFHANYNISLRDLFNTVLKLEIEEEPDARSAMVQRSGPPIFTHIREASFLAKVLQLDLSNTEVQKIVEEIYLQAGRREYVEALLPELSGDSRWSLLHNHLVDIMSALGLASLTRNVCTLKAPEPVDPQLAEAMGR